MSTNGHVRLEDVYFIEPDDGWAIDGYLAPVERVHGPVRFKYRPLDPIERSKLMQDVSNQDGEEKAKTLVVTELADRLKSWNLKKEPIFENVRTLRNVMLDRLLEIVVYQTEVGDEDPTWSQEDKELHRRAANYDEPGFGLQEELAKN